MPRQARLLLSQTYYHIMMRGNNRQLTFSKNEDYEYYLSLIRRFKSEHSFNLYHYCLMPNHYHLLIKTGSAAEFATFMKKLNLAYFHYYNKHYNLIGHLWQGRYKSQPVGKDEYFIQCGKYLELNPIRTKLVETPEAYAYSSYRHYAFGESDPLLSEDPFYNFIGQVEQERQQNYRRLTISESVLVSYSDRVWGSPEQRYNEVKKINYHQRDNEESIH